MIILGVEPVASPNPMTAAATFPAYDPGEVSLRFGDLEIRPTSRQALASGGRVQLTRRELDVLMILAKQPDRVVKREAIYREVWGGQMPYRDRAVDVYVRRVREKLRSLTPDVKYIHTHFGIGYRFWTTQAEAAQTEAGDQSHA